MLFAPVSYDDFLLICGGLGAPDAVFYHTDGTYFFIHAAYKSSSICVKCVNITPPPPSFSTDFPAAIQLSNFLGSP